MLTLDNSLKLKQTRLHFAVSQKRDKLRFIKLSYQLREMARDADEGMTIQS